MFAKSEKEQKIIIMAEKRTKEAKKFTDLNEIFEHNTKDSLWLLIDNKVYDVTNFKHPGGK